MFLTRALLTIVAFTLLALQPVSAQNLGIIQGKVTDVSGAAILGAVVTVESPQGGRHTTVTDGNGAFAISSLAPGKYSVKISASGLSDWTLTDVPATPQGSPPLSAVLNVAPAATTVTVGVSPKEVAAAQLKQQEKQRVLGVIPNFFVAYEKHPAPLSTKQKLQLGLRFMIDPVTFFAQGVTAGIQQEQNSYHQYGQGLEGYAKRYGAQYATAADGVFLGGVVMDSIMHQDPRYFYSGEGSRVDRLGYALKSSILARGDNGRWQFPYADLAGVVAAAEVAQTYLPGSRTQITILGRGLLFHYVGRVAYSLTEEFLFKKLTTNAPPDSSASNLPALREGTPVPLVAVDDLTAAGTSSKTVNFVLAEDLTRNGKVLVKTGAVASGQVTQVSAAQSTGQAGSVRLEHVILQAGSVNVPLRSSQVRGVGSLQYKRLPDSGKIEFTLYVAENVSFPESSH